MPEEEVPAGEDAQRMPPTPAYKEGRAAKGSAPAEDEPVAASDEDVRAAGRTRRAQESS